ncbi:M14 family zinc carboxypeptidase [Balneolales bacterium ANBcel1]|nr:M14 family zinc carboxypeptidase [Balneolales bacterium ANBcel1]
MARFFPRHIAPLYVILFICLFPGFLAAGSGIQSPAQFLGYEPGDRFTRHHEIKAYFKHIAAASPLVELYQYGESYQGRPLFVAIVSSEENIRARDTIRINNRRAAGLESGMVEGRTAAIAWMSYGLHGNESSSPEAAMLTLYELVSGQITSVGHTPGEVAQWLDRTLVIMDPVLNPDGRQRYVSWFEQTVGRHPDPRMETREHDEPWPGGRSNHYYFDLNRDWAWQVQQESQQRAALYHMWMPHVHADFHEMHVNDYFFPPSAEPFHNAITPWQREFQHKVGDNHSAYFDRRGERYFTREIFDLFYPGYGDTWPTFNGAIGMTYEQMGHGRAGTAMIRANGDTLTLAQRLMNQHVVGLSTVEVTAANSERLKDEFTEYFRKGAEAPAGDHDFYVIGGENHPDRMKALLDFLDRQEIRYFHAVDGRRMSGRNYLTGRDETRRTSGKDIVIPLAQPKSALTRILFEPNPELPDSNTYDITAWALPYAYGVQAWAADGRVRMDEAAVRVEPRYRPLKGAPNEPADDSGQTDVAGHYAYAIPWGDVNDAAFLAGLMQEGIHVQLAEKRFTTGGETFEPGSMVIVSGANRQVSSDRLYRLVDYYAARYDRRVTALESGRVASGPDFGSPQLHLAGAPAVAVPAGAGVNVANLGEIRHFFDYRLEYPLAVFNLERLSSFPLDDYDVLILPDGSYLGGDRFDWDAVMEWVAAGGRVIAFPDAVRALAGREETALILRDWEEGTDMEREQARFEDRRRAGLSRQISGAVFRVTLDDSHPLAFGLGSDYAALKRGSLAIDPLSGGWNVGMYAGDSMVLGGWAGSEALELQEGALAIGNLRHGSGQIVLFADNPLFRGFWRNGELLLSNALFQMAIIH